MNTLIAVKNTLRTKFSRLITNILKIILFKDEEKISCIIAAYYEFSLEETMIAKALSQDNYTWLMFVWAFKKNYIGNRRHMNSLFITFE